MFLRFSSDEFSRAVYRLIAREFGAAGLARFLRENMPGTGDYTLERRRWAENVTFEEIAVGFCREEGLRLVGHECERADGLLRNELLKKVKEIVRSFDPNAKIVLYGSQARGDATAESDWNFLILTEHAHSAEHCDRIRDALYELEWATGHVLCSIFHTAGEWNSERFKIMPFHREVERDGMLI